MNTIGAKEAPDLCLVEAKDHIAHRVIRAALIIVPEEEARGCYKN